MIKVSLEARELLPCPFCGGEAEIVERNNPMSKWKWSVDCRSSTCGMSGPVESSRATAIALWNTRDEQLIRSMVIDEAAGEGWQPIETAPKDGTEVLGYREDCGVLLMRWCALADFLTDAELAELDEETAFAADWFYADFLHGGRLEGEEAPTHWRPLPAPPSIRQLGERGR